MYAGWLSAGCDALPDYSAQLVEMFRVYFASAQVSDKEIGAADANRYRKLLLLLLRLLGLLVLLCSTPHMSAHRLAFDAIIQPLGSGLPTSLQQREMLVLSILSRQSSQVPAIHSIVVSTRLLSLLALVVQALHAFRALLTVHVAILNLGVPKLAPVHPLKLECHAGGCG